MFGLKIKIKRIIFGSLIQMIWKFNKIPQHRNKLIRNKAKNLNKIVTIILKAKIKTILRNQLTYKPKIQVLFQINQVILQNHKNLFSQIVFLQCIKRNRRNNLYLFYVCKNKKTQQNQKAQLQVSLKNLPSDKLLSQKMLHQILPRVHQKQMNQMSLLVVIYNFLFSK